MFNKIRNLYLFVGITTLMTITAFAGSWGKDAKGWWYLNDDGTYAKSEWKWIDGNGDWIAECYYFDSDGYLRTNTVTPDGEKVNEDGAWINHIYGNVERKPSSNQYVYLQPGIYYQKSAVTYWNHIDYDDGRTMVHEIYKYDLNPKNTIIITGSGDTLSFQWKRDGWNTFGTFSRKTDGNYDIRHHNQFVDGFESLDGIGVISDSLIILKNWEEGDGSADTFYIMEKE